MAMSGEEEEGDKQYEPSQKKLEDARKKGEIPRSTDLTTAAAYAGFLLVLMTIGPLALVDVATALQIILAQVIALSDLVFEGSGVPLHGGMLIAVAWGIAIWFAGPAALAILSVISQRAFLVTPSKIAPKLNRISPISGVKNKLGRQGLFEFTKSSAKLVIYTIVMGVFLVAQIDRIIGSILLTPRQIVVELGQMIGALMVIVLLISLVLGGVDYFWQSADHIRKNKMSRKEKMDEFKQSEGDPFMKQQRRQRGQELATNKMLVDVPTADVVIVNPTHFAVALKWSRSTAAPICVAKGVDETAARIRELASEHAVPLHSDPPTARALYADVEIGQEIAQEHYRAVAAAIRFADSMQKKARKR
jgi:flagellar biosynthetic protein FlhB